MVAKLCTIYRLLLCGKEGCHPVHHLLLLDLHVLGHVGGQPGLQVRANPYTSQLSVITVIDNSFYLFFSINSGIFRTRFYI
jgi:hypothetical protein